MESSNWKKLTFFSEFLTCTTVGLIEKGFLIPIYLICKLEKYANGSSEHIQKIKDSVQPRVYLDLLFQKGPIKGHIFH